jgi:hypothetical protein
MKEYKNTMEKRKLRGWLARDWITAFTVFTAVMGLMFLMVQGLAVEYDNEDIVNSNFNNVYNKYDELSGTVDDMYSEASGENGLSFTGTLTLLFSATVTVIQLIFGTLLLPGAMLKQFALDIGAPSAVANIIFTLPLVVITITIVLVVISSISNQKL